MKTKSVTIRAAWIGGAFLIIATIIGGTFQLFHQGEGDSEVIENQINESESSQIQINKENQVKGDMIQGAKVIDSDRIDGDKVETKKIETKVEETLEAPNALIVTKNQSGGQNTVNNVTQLTSQSYQQLSNSVISKLVSNLQYLEDEYPNPPKIIIEIESGNSLRHKVANDLERILVANNLGYYPKGNTFMGRFPEFPISVFTSSKNLEYTQDFIKTIEPYLTSQYFIDTSFSGNQRIKFYINGIPTFNQNGQVRIE